jgi:hypothetical protein
MIGEVSVTGYLKTTLANYQQSEATYANFRALHEAAGLSDSSGGSLIDIPTIRDYRLVGDYDHTGETGSNCYAAYKAMEADINDNGLTAFLQPGVYNIDGPEPITTRNGGGMWGIPVGHNTNGYDSGRRGVILQRPYGVNRMVPLIAYQRGSLLANFQAWDSDTVDRIQSGAAEIDASGYPTITGSPDVMAPLIASSHAWNDDGTASVAGENVGGAVISNVGLFGYEGCFAGDPDIADEDWAEGFSSGEFKGIPGLTLDIYGYCLNRALILHKAHNGVDVLGFDFRPPYWTELQQMDLGGGNEQPAVRWAQRNLHFIECRNKVLARFRSLLARSGRKVFDCASGGAGKSGKFRFRVKEMSVERVPTLIHLATTAYMHRSKFEGTGHFMDHDDPTNVDPVIHIETDKDLAGSIDKDTGLLKPMGDYTGWRNDFSGVEVVEASGEVLLNTAEDGHNNWKVPVDKARWGQGSKLTLYAITNLSTRTKIIDGPGLTQAADNASKKVYNVVDATVGADQMLVVFGQQFSGCNEAAIVSEGGVAQAAWAGFVGCNTDAALNTADEADDDDDGDPGDLDAPE